MSWMGPLRLVGFARCLRRNVRTYAISASYTALISYLHTFPILPRLASPFHVHLPKLSTSQICRMSVVMPAAKCRVFRGTDQIIFTISLPRNVAVSQHNQSDSHSRKRRL